MRTRTAWCAPRPAGSHRSPRPTPSRRWPSARRRRRSSARSHAASRGSEPARWPRSSSRGRRRDAAATRSTRRRSRPRCTPSTPLRPLRGAGEPRAARRGQPRAHRGDRRRRGTAHPLAGTVAARRRKRRRGPRRVAPRVGEEPAEHALVVDDIVARLSPLCETLHAASSPSIVRLTTTRVSGRGSTASSASPSTPPRRPRCSPPCTRRPRSAGCLVTPRSGSSASSRARRAGCGRARSAGWTPTGRRRGRSRCGGSWSTPTLRGLGRRGDRGRVRARRRARRDGREARVGVARPQRANQALRACSGRSSAHPVTNRSASTTIALDIFDVPWTRSMNVIGTSRIVAPAVRARWVISIWKA